MAHTKPNIERRSYGLLVMLNIREHLAIRRLAKVMGIPLSGLVRMWLMAGLQTAGLSLAEIPSPPSTRQLEAASRRPRDQGRAIKAKSLQRRQQRQRQAQQQERIQWEMNYQSFLANRGAAIRGEDMAKV